MKPKISQSHLDSNRKNGKLYSHLGGIAYAKKMEEQYLNNPSFCTHCNIILPQSKKRNKFCSRSCSAKYNNANRSPLIYEQTKITWAAKPTSKLNKIKEPKHPYSTLFRCTCQHCGTKSLLRTQTKYCDNCTHLYSHAGRAKYWFSFNVFHYPELFDLSLITTYGFRDNKTNPNGITRDHRVSVNDAIRNNYNPYYIKHPLNCELMFFNENNKKKTKSSITYEELIKLVDDYDNNLYKNQ